MSRAKREHRAKRIQGLLLAGDVSQALSLSREWLAVAPEDPDAWFCNAVCRHVNEDIDGALESFDQVLQRVPGHIQALSGRAGMLARKGQYEAALAACRAATARTGNDPDLHLNEAQVLESLERFPAALESYDQALRLDPNHKAALMNRGLLLARMTRFEEAARQGAAVAARFPDQALAQVNHAEILLKASCYPEALEACERALVVEPDTVAALIIKAIALAALGRLGEADETLAILRQDPMAADVCCRMLLGEGCAGLSDLALMDIWFHAAWQRLRACDWRHYDEDAALARRQFTTGREGFTAVAGSRYCQPLQSFSVDDGVRRQHALKLTGQVQGALQPQVFIARDAVRDARPRIAYLIADLDNDPMVPLFLPLLRAQRREDFCIIVYCLCATGESALLDELRHSSEAVIDLSGLSDQEAAFRIYQDDINILVELNPYTEHSRPAITAHRPAPVQVWYGGYGGTSGAAWMDYALVDKGSSPPEDRPYWTEQRALLRAPAIALPLNGCVASATGRDVLGLPTEAFIFCSFNRPEKIEPLVFGAWMRMLLRVPGSVLWLQAYSREAISGLMAQADYRGVAGERLLFTVHEPDRDAYLAHLAAADLYLDTYLNNGFIRVTDALLAGVPILACRGAQVCGRRSAALLEALDLDELVCPDLAAYESLAVALATDPGRLQALRKDLAGRRTHSRLFDARRQATELDAAYAHMWARHNENLAAAEFTA